MSQKHFFFILMLVVSTAGIAQDLDTVDCGPGTDLRKVISYLPEEMIHYQWMLYPNEQLHCEGREIEGEKQGWWKFYFDSGQIKAIGEYVNGERNAFWKFYHANGTLAASGDFFEGSKNGYWRSYDDDGRLASEGWYEDDTMESWWKFYGGDFVIEEGEFIGGEKSGYWKFYRGGELMFLKLYE